MRLSAFEVKAIRTCALAVFGPRCVVRLFGSRVDDTRRGGDIDLHVVAGSPDMATLDHEILFSIALKDAIGEQRIDIIARPPGFIPRGIDDLAFQTGVVLT